MTGEPRGFSRVAAGKKTVTPKMYALATIIFFVILFLLLLSNLSDADTVQAVRTAREKRKTAKRG